MRLTPEGVYEETKRIVREETIKREEIRWQALLKRQQQRASEQLMDRIAAAWAVERELYDPRPRTE